MKQVFITTIRIAIVVGLLLVVPRLVRIGLAVWDVLRARNPTYVVAVYKDFDLTRDPSFFELDTAEGDGHGIAHVYVQLLDGRRFLLSELPEAVAGELLQKGVNLAGPPSPTTFYSDQYRHSILAYRDGKLTLAILHATSELFSISPNKDGPYLKLPIDHDTLIKVFGPPVEWERRTRHGPKA